jgi:hypothetical protein
MHVLTTATCSVPHRYAALPGVQSHGVSVRVMNYFCNMNSKTLFRFMLDDATLMARHRPVSIHINYHPEKLPRMEDVFQHFYGAADDVDLGAGLGLPTKRNASGGYDKAAIAERVQAANRAAHSHSKDGCCGGGCHE